MQGPKSNNMSDRTSSPAADNCPIPGCGLAGSEISTCCSSYDRFADLESICSDPRHYYDPDRESIVTTSPHESLKNVDSLSSHHGEDVRTADPSSPAVPGLIFHANESIRSVSLSKMNPGQKLMTLYLLQLHVMIQCLRRGILLLPLYR